MDGSLSFEEKTQQHKEGGMSLMKQLPICENRIRDHALPRKYGEISERKIFPAHKRNPSFLVSEDAKTVR